MLTKSQQRRLEKNRSSVIEGVRAYKITTDVSKKIDVEDHVTETIATDLTAEVLDNQLSLSTVAVIKCSICAARVKRINLEKHIAKVHQLVPCDKCNKLFTSRDLKEHRKHFHGIGDKFILLSQTGQSTRGTLINVPTECSECHKVMPLVWRYRWSTRGVVYLCSVCKGKVFDRSFRHKDALDFAQTGGGFDSNRRRH